MFVLDASPDGNSDGPHALRHGGPSFCLRPTGRGERTATTPLREDQGRRNRPTAPIRTAKGENAEMEHERFGVYRRPRLPQRRTNAGRLQTSMPEGCGDHRNAAAAMGAEHAVAMAAIKASIDITKPRLGWHAPYARLDATEKNNLSYWIGMRVVRGLRRRLRNYFSSHIPAVSPLRAVFKPHPAGTNHEYTIR